jgi:hypothetical protein
VSVRHGVILRFGHAADPTTTTNRRQCTVESCEGLDFGCELRIEPGDLAGVCNKRGYKFWVLRGLWVRRLGRSGSDSLSKIRLNSRREQEGGIERDPIERDPVTIRVVIR